MLFGVRGDLGLLRVSRGVVRRSCPLNGVESDAAVGQISADEDEVLDGVDRQPRCRERFDEFALGLGDVSCPPNSPTWALPTLRTRPTEGGAMRVRWVMWPIPVGAHLQHDAANALAQVGHCQ